MNAVMGILRSPKQEKIAWLLKQVPVIGIILLVAVDDSLGNGVSKHWLPTLGFALGVSLVCFGFFKVFPLFRKIRTMEATISEKIAWISGISLAIIGGMIIILNDSIAAIFNVQSLHTFVFSFVVGLGVVCLGY